MHVRQAIHHCVASSDLIHYSLYSRDLVKNYQIKVQNEYFNESTEELHFSFLTFVFFLFVVLGLVPRVSLQTKQVPFHCAAPEFSASNLLST